MIKTIKKIDGDGDDHVDDCTSATDHKHTRKQRNAKIFTASRSTTEIPKINIFGILAKILFNAYFLTLRVLMSYIYIYDISSLMVNDLTLILLTWRKW